jgi:hypothetical protein
MPPYTRRGVLASLGIGGVGAASLPLLADAGPYTSYTYAQSPGDDRVQVAWYETYNGSVLEHQRGTGGATANETLDPDRAPNYVPEVSGPVVSLEDVMPGDSGSLAIGIQLAERPEGSNPISLDLTGTIAANEENGRTEPERKAGDSSDAVGELADRIEATVWIDDGPFRCDGIRLLDTTLAEGTLTDVIGALADGTRLCTGCFGVRPHHCLGIEWSLPAGTGNVVQTDGVEFELAIEAHDRGEA